MRLIRLKLVPVIVMILMSITSITMATEIPKNQHEFFVT